jgi:hypothetical protein
MDLLYRSNTNDAEHIRAMILFDDVSDDYGIHDGWNLMKIMWNSDKMTRIVQKTLRRMIISAVKWTSLIIIFIGTGKTKWDKVKSTTHI